MTMQQGARAYRVRVAAIGVLVAAGGLVIGGCSSSGGSSSTPATTAPTANASQVQNEVTQDWQAFFNKSTPVADKEKYLENGSALSGTLQQFAGNPLTSQVTATVTSVQTTSPTTATVNYNIVGANGTTLESGATGEAVLQNGTWVVSDASLCGLLSLTGTTPSQCAS